jgi:S-DNA-T family DNA segregation ATPase FtsK/SpoIIIE
MLEQRDLKVDLVALGLLALSIFLAASLLSFDPADPPNTLVYPQPATITNVCGRSGAVVSSLLLGSIGVGAYYVVLSLLVLDSILLTRRPIGQPVLRLVGWLLSLTGLTALFALAFPQLCPGPVIGSGGFVGAAMRGLLERNFASVGAYILTVSVLLGGLLLSTDYLVLRILGWMIGLPIAGLGRGVVVVGGAYADRLANRRAKAVEDNEEDEEDEEDEASEPTVRIAGRHAEEEKGEKPQPAEEPPAETPAEEPAKPAEEAKEPAPLKIRKPRKTQREELIEQIEAASQTQGATDYELPGVDLLLESEPFCFDEQEKDVRRKAKILEKTFADFGFNVRVVEIQTGPVIAQFEIELEAGLRLSKITSLADDLAIALRVPSVRIVAPIPGKNTVGVEVPNFERQLVRLREVIEETNGKAQSMRVPIFLGKDVSGNAMTVDLASMPHLLIAGRTGTGKSVCLNSIIVSMIMTRRPDEVRMLLIDPKMVELSPYKSIPHLMHPVVTDMRKAEAILAWAVEKMEERYALLARAGVRHLASYNQLGEEELMERLQPADDEERRNIPITMPYIVIVADEMADLMMTAAKEVEGHIIRLAQKSRAVGIHLVLATQKPTVDVITGLIKSNLPARICFEVSSRTDSRVVLDEMGAEKLLGNGDMLFLRPGTSTLIRGQGTYLSDDEINQVISAVATNEPQFVKELVQLKTAEEEEADGPQFKSRDELYEAAIDLVVREQRGSVSLLQRALGIGYGRAARLIDFMAEDGFVGPYNGSQAREILLTLEKWEAMQGKGKGEKPAAVKRPSNKILLGPPPKDPLESPPARTQTRKPVSAPEDELEDEDADLDDLQDEPGREDQSVDSDDDELEDEEDYSDEGEEDEEDEFDEENLEEYEEYDDEEDGQGEGPHDDQPWRAESA